MKSEGWDVGKNRLYRLYRQENLGLRRRRPWRHVSAVHRHPKRPAGGSNDVWAMDFVADQLADGRRVRTLTILDLFTRECLGIEVGFSLRAEDVVTALNYLEYDRGLPNLISCDNGSEFSGGMMGQWAYSNQVEIDFNRRGKPTDNAIVESFNGRFREERLNTHWFDSINDAKEKIDHWKWGYNERRPHRSLEGLTPREFADRTKHQGVANSNSLVSSFWRPVKQLPSTDSSLSGLIGAARAISFWNMTPEQNISGSLHGSITSTSHTLQKYQGC